ncbi:MAG: AAA family ATPase [Bacteroidota bacterium]
MNTLQQPRPVIGTGDFGSLVAGGIFVDKTLLIADLLADGAEALLITRPRRWGKTLNMSMLYHFLRCEVRENATAHKLETLSPHEGFFDSLKIGKKHPELIANHQGKWPVISLTLKGVQNSDLPTIEQNFKDIFTTLYSRHSYLDDWLCTLEQKRAVVAKDKYFADVLEGNLGLSGLQKALYFLTELLYEYHGRKVFVLLDEYDTPLNNTFPEPALYKEVLSFMRGLLGNSFKDNPYLEKGIITGILRVAKADLFSGLNNFMEYSVLHKKYAEHFGFTDAEVSDLFAHPRVQAMIEAPAPASDAIKAWYNGYTIGGLTIYNPWSIMNCITEHGQLAPYWVSSGSDTLLRELLKGNGHLVYQIEQLLAQDRIQVTISPYINMLDMSPTLKFWSLMLAAGYATLAEAIPTLPATTYPCWIRIPNMEVRAAYEGLIIGWFGDQVGPSHYTDMIESLFFGDIELFSEALNGYLTEATSVRNVGLHKAEQYYSGFMVGLFTVIQKDYAIHSEAESGEGYADMLAIPRKANGKVAVIFEYKVASSKETLASKVQEALDQIDKKGYIMRVKNYGHIEKVMKVGVAFYGKEALVTSESVQLSG